MFPLFDAYCVEQMFVATRDATNKSSSSNNLAPPIFSDGAFLEGIMQTGYFYFLKEEYFKIFKDPHLMGNKEKDGKGGHARPCFLAIKEEGSTIFWMVPISSKVEKYKSLYEHKISRLKACDTLVFGNVLGQDRAFLIQNMCPVTSRYVEETYLERGSGVPVTIADDLKQEIAKKATKVLQLQRKGRKLIFPDVLLIERKLMEEEKEKI